MSWAQRLKRVFNIDVSICPQCGGEAKVIACFEDQPIIDKIPSLGS
jgi:rRNA maturation endonuclease Nob1